MKTIKKEIVYTMPYETDEQIEKALALRARLYRKFNNVGLYPNGLHEVRVIATNS